MAKESINNGNKSNCIGDKKMKTYFGKVEVKFKDIVNIIDSLPGGQIDEKIHFFATDKYYLELQITNKLTDNKDVKAAYLVYMIELDSNEKSKYTRKEVIINSKRRNSHCDVLNCPSLSYKAIKRIKKLYKYLYKHQIIHKYNA